MFERFTERARQVVVFAQDEARSLKHNYIGTEHLLLGLLREEEGLAARVLRSFGLELEEVRARVTAIIGVGEDATSGQIPFTPRAKKALELSMREALGMGHNFIGTEHILLGLARVTDGVGARVLADLGFNAERIRNDVIRKLGGPGVRPIPMPSRALRRARWPLLPIAAGWAMFGVAAGLGVLLGWLIWG
jgi:ATP-dependent Clp protease ATP-binding subunit ClpC